MPVIELLSATIESSARTRPRSALWRGSQSLQSGKTINEPRHRVGCRSPASDRRPRLILWLIAGQEKSYAHREASPTLPPRSTVWMLLVNAWQDWRTALMVVHPDTVVRWHRQWLRRQWTRRSARGRSGRPSTTATIRTLVMKMAAANPLWGAPRIHGELGKLGIEVSERSVSRLVRRPRRPLSQTWRTFLANHLPALGAMDFFTVGVRVPARGGNVAGPRG